MSVERIVIVTGETRLEKLKGRFNTVGQAKFYVERQGVDFEEVQAEDKSLKKAVSKVQDDLISVIKNKEIDKSFLPNYIFTENDLVVVIGQDGLVANTAKYAHNIPIIAVNPDPSRYDGVLLPFSLSNYQRAIDKVTEGNYNVKKVSMAQASLNDGQRLLAFNDLFIGPKTHTSARYQIKFKGQEESQSSSGIIVSTGAGSTGWLSSIFNMANGIGNSFTGHTSIREQKLDWESNDLIYIVREPFASKTSNINIVAGLINRGATLELKSLMPRDGFIFSDGIVDDFLEFNTGSVAKISLATEKAHLVSAE